MVLQVNKIATIQQLLAHRAQQDPAKLAFRFLSDNGDEETALNLKGLSRRAHGIAVMLRNNGLCGKRIALVNQKAEHFICAFFGILAAGSTAVPLSLSRMGFSDSRLELTLEDAEVAAVLTDAVTYGKLAKLLNEKTELNCNVLIVDAIGEHDEAASIEVVDGESTAVIQYTSGSTSRPKGVEISHSNLLHNASVISEILMLNGRSDLIGLNWLPLFHDNGLVW